MNIVIKFGFFAIIVGIANTKAKVAYEIPLHIDAISTTESQDGASTGIVVGAGIPALHGAFPSFIEDQDKDEGGEAVGCRKQYQSCDTQKMEIHAAFCSFAVTVYVGNSENCSSAVSKNDTSTRKNVGTCSIAAIFARKIFQI